MPFQDIPEFADGRLNGGFVDLICVFCEVSSLVGFAGFRSVVIAKRLVAAPTVCHVAPSAATITSRVIEDPIARWAMSDTRVISAGEDVSGIPYYWGKHFG